MEDLDEKIKDHIELIIAPAKKELDYIKGRDWSNISEFKKRESEYKLQEMLNHRNINALIKLHALAKNDLKHPEVKATMAILMQFYKILEKRYSNMETKFDWTTVYEGDQDEEAKKMKEIEFQSGVLTDLTKHKSDLRKINFGEDTDEINIQMHADTPIPMMMADMVEGRYPEIKEFLKRKDKD